MSAPKFHYNHLFTSSPIECKNYLVYQTGEMFCDADTVIEPHKQFCFEITYCVNGSGTVYNDDNGTRLTKNCCFVSFNGEMHSIIPDKSNPLRFKFLAINPISADGKRYVELIKKYAEQSKTRVTEIPFINTVLLDIFKEMEQTDVFSHELTDFFISRLLIGIARAYEHFSSLDIYDNFNRNKSLVYRITNYLDTKFLNIKNLYELEDEFNYSYNHLSAVFKRYMGVSIKEYLTRLKMEEAQKLIKKNCYTVTEISEKLNYSCIHTFSRSYKNYFGVSPTK